MQLASQPAIQAFRQPGSQAARQPGLQATRKRLPASELLNGLLGTAKGSAKGLGKR